MIKHCLGLSIAAAIGLSSFSTVAANNTPGQPIVQWMETNFAIVDVNHAATAYTELVTVKDAAEIPVAWDRWSGNPGDKWRVLLNGEVAFEKAVKVVASQKDSAKVRVTKGGQYDMVIELCAGEGVEEACSQSEVTKIVVADTDGSHLDPLNMNVDPNNGSYKAADGTVVGAYFVEWGVYGRKFPVDKIPAQNLTHLIYGFVPVCGPNPSLGEIEQGNSLAALNRACKGTDDFEVVIHDPWAAIQMPHKQSGHENSTSYKGTYGQLMALKQRYPDLKIVPSIGGWTLSDPFYSFTDKAKRDVFVASVKKFLTTWKFYDGVDVDWEFPGGDGANPNLGDEEKDGAAYVALMRELRAMLDNLEAETGREYELTSAIGAGYDKIRDVDYADAVQYMDYIFAMTYDFYGAWSNDVGHQTALYCGSHMSAGECDGTGLDDAGKPRKGPAYTSHNGIDLLLKQGVPANKLVLGAAMYGRGWTGVTEASMTDPSNPMTGVGNGPVEGSWEAGIYDYKDVVTKFVNNPTVIKGYDERAEAAYAYDPSNGELVSYDSPRSIMAKGQYVKDLGLAGLFAWEIDADNGDILNAMQESLVGNSVPVNKKPLANAGNDTTITESQAVVLDGSQSRDLDGDIVSYQWKQVFGDTLTVMKADQAIASVDVVLGAVNQTYVFELTVTDNEGKIAKDRVTITADTGVVESNTAPTALVEGPTQANANEVVTLNASGSTDPEQDVLTFSWTTPVGLGVTVDGAKISFVAGSFDVDTSFTFEVAVSDGEFTVNQSKTVTVLKTVNVDPTCDVTPWDAAGTFNTGDIVQHNGKSWKAGWWTQGQEPGKTGEWGVWQEVASECGETGGEITPPTDGGNEGNTGGEITPPTDNGNEGNTDGVVTPPAETCGVVWSSSDVYNSGDTVVHDDQTWKAKWWTQGQAPGTTGKDGVWQAVNC